MVFFRQEYWSGLPFPSPGDIPSPGIKPASQESPALQADSLPAELSGKLSPSHTLIITQIRLHFLANCWSFNGPEPGGPESKREKEADIPWFTRKANRALCLGLAEAPGALASG